MLLIIDHWHQAENCPAGACKPNLDFAVKMNEGAKACGVQVIEGFVDLINRLKEAGSTSIFITNDVHFVAEVATMAIVLEKGRLLFSGTPRELFNSPEVMEEASLSDPMMHRLALRLDRGLSSVIRMKEFDDCLEVAG